MKCKLYVNSWHAANSSFAFWNLLEFFFRRLVESVNVEPLDTED